MESKPLQRFQCVEVNFDCPQVPQSSTSVKKPVLQCDASKGGLGAYLLQSGHPIAYASRVSTPTEVHYGKIEKELLSSVFGVEKFSEFLYGLHFVIETDHKPLETIVHKSLLSSAKRLTNLTTFTET